jgi:hypothetical protein
VGHGDGLREEFDGVTGAFAAGFRDVNLVASVMLKGWAQVPADFSVGCP